MSNCAMGRIAALSLTALLMSAAATTVVAAADQGQKVSAAVGKPLKEAQKAGQERFLSTHS